MKSEPIILIPSDPFIFPISPLFSFARLLKGLFAIALATTFCLAFWGGIYFAGVAVVRCFQG